MNGIFNLITRPQQIQHTAIIRCYSSGSDSVLKDKEKIKRYLLLKKNFDPNNLTDEEKKIIQEMTKEKFKDPEDSISKAEKWKADALKRQQQEQEQEKKLNEARSFFTSKMEQSTKEEKQLSDKSISLRKKKKKTKDEDLSRTSFLHKLRYKTKIFLNRFKIGRKEDVFSQTSDTRRIFPLSKVVGVRKGLEVPIPNNTPGQRELTLLDNFYHHRVYKETKDSDYMDSDMPMDEYWFKAQREKLAALDEMTPKMDDSHVKPEDKLPRKSKLFEELSEEFMTEIPPPNPEEIKKLKDELFLWPKPPVPDPEELAKISALSQEERADLYKKQLKELIPKTEELMKNSINPEEDGEAQFYQKQIENDIQEGRVDFRKMDPIPESWRLRSYKKFAVPLEKRFMEFVKKELETLLDPLEELEKNLLKKEGVTDKELNDFEIFKQKIIKEKEELEKMIPEAEEHSELFLKVAEQEEAMKNLKRSMIIDSIAGKVYRQWFQGMRLKKFALREARKVTHERLFEFDVPSNPKLTGMKRFQQRRFVKPPKPQKAYVWQVLKQNLLKNEKLKVQNEMNSPYYVQIPEGLPYLYKTELPAEFLERCDWEKRYGGIFGAFAKIADEMQVLGSPNFDPFNWEDSLKNGLKEIHKEKDEKKLKFSEDFKQKEIALEEAQQKSIVEGKDLLLQEFDFKFLGEISSQEYKKATEEDIEEKERKQREMEEEEKRIKEKLMKKRKTLGKRFLSYKEYKELKENGMLAYQLRAQRKETGKSMLEMLDEKGLVLSQKDEPQGLMTTLTKVASNLANSLSTTIFGKILPTVGLQPVIELFAERVKGFDLETYEKNFKIILTSYLQNYMKGNVAELKGIPEPILDGIRKQVEARATQGLLVFSNLMKTATKARVVFAQVAEDGTPTLTFQLIARVVYYIYSETTGEMQPSMLSFPQKTRVLLTVTADKGGRIKYTDFSVRFQYEKREEASRRKEAGANRREDLNKDRPGDRDEEFEEEETRDNKSKRKEDKKEEE